jgi:hypothetical protein
MPSRNPLDPIPHPPRTPWLGNLLSLGATSPVQNMAKLARQYWPIYWLDMMGAPLVVVSGADLVDEISDEKRFDKSVRGSLRRVRAVGGDGLFRESVAVAADRFQTSRVHDVNPAVSLMDQLALLECRQCLRDLGSREAERVRDALLRQLNRVGSRAIATDQEPSTETRHHGVGGQTDRGLHHLPHDIVHVGECQGLQVLTAPTFPVKGFAGDPVRRTRQLDDGLIG